MERQRASNITIAKEKMSASLLYFPLSRTSGAVHRGVWPCSLEPSSSSLMSIARPKSAIRARPELSIRTFD